MFYATTRSRFKNTHKSTTRTIKKQTIESTALCFRTTEMASSDLHNQYSTLTNWAWETSMFGFKINECFMQQSARDLNTRKSTKREQQKN